MFPYVFHNNMFGTVPNTFINDTEDNTEKYFKQSAINWEKGLSHVNEHNTISLWFRQVKKQNAYRKIK